MFICIVISLNLLFPLSESLNTIHWVIDPQIKIIWNVKLTAEKQWHRLRQKLIPFFIQEVNNFSYFSLLIIYVAASGPTALNAIAVVMIYQTKYISSPDTQQLQICMLNCRHDISNCAFKWPLNINMPQKQTSETYPPWKTTFSSPIFPHLSECQFHASIYSGQKSWSHP